MRYAKDCTVNYRSVAIEGNKIIKFGVPYQNLPYFPAEIYAS